VTSESGRLTLMPNAKQEVLKLPQDEAERRMARWLEK
jgi:hypothetical protein